MIKSTLWTSRLSICGIPYTRHLMDKLLKNEVIYARISLSLPGIGSRGNKLNMS